MKRRILTSLMVFALACATDTSTPGDGVGPSTSGGNTTGNPGSGGATGNPGTGGEGTGNPGAGGNPVGAGGNAGGAGADERVGPHARQERPAHRSFHRGAADDRRRGLAEVRT